MRLLICTLAISLFQPNWLAAQSVVRDIKNARTDSCFLSVHQVVTLEMTKPFEEPFEKELTRLRISNEDSKALLKKAVKKSSYQYERALLPHYNVMFHFYKDGAALATIQLSTLTGSIVIHSINTPEKFYNRVSGRFGRFLVNTLMKYDVLELLPDDQQTLDQDAR